MRKIDFTSATATAKGLQLTTTSESRVLVPASAASSSSSTSSSSTAAAAAAGAGGNAGTSAAAADDSGLQVPIITRRRASSLGLPPGVEDGPPVMVVTGCVNEDGLGMLSWCGGDGEGGKGGDK